MPKNVLRTSPTSFVKLENAHRIDLKLNKDGRRWKLMATFTIDDPFMVQLRGLSSVFQPLVASPLESLPRTRWLEFALATASLLAFTQEIETDYPEGSPLARSVYSFNEFKLRFLLALSEARAVVGYCRRELEAADGRPPERSYVSDPMEDFTKLENFKLRLTPAHLALQAHFSSLMTHWVSISKDLGAVERFFNPLQALRDEYFMQPREGLLEEYLKLASQVAAQGEHRPMVLDRTGKLTSSKLPQGEVDRQAVELEAFSLLEGL